jgi:hypothetical protein
MRFGSVEGRGHGLFDEAVETALAGHHGEIFAEPVATEDV